MGVVDALANLKATSFGHACFLVEFPGEVQPSTSAQSFGLGVRCGRHQPSKRHAIQLCRVLNFPSTMPYQRSLTGHTHLTSLLA